MEVKAGKLQREKQRCSLTKQEDVEHSGALIQ